MFFISSALILHQHLCFNSHHETSFIHGSNFFTFRIRVQNLSFTIHTKDGEKKLKLSLSIQVYHHLSKPSKIHTILENAINLEAKDAENETAPLPRLLGALMLVKHGDFGLCDNFSLGIDYCISDDDLRVLHNSNFDFSPNRLTLK